MNFHPQDPVPPTRFLNQHAKDAAKLRILLWRAIIFLVYSSIHCLGMFVFAVFGFRAFSDLSKFNELNQKHKWNISLVLIFGSYKSRVSPTPVAAPQLTPNCNSPETFRLQFCPFANILREQFWCLLFLRCLFTLHMQKGISSSSSQPNSSVKPPQQQDKLQLWHISSQKQSSWGAPGPPWLITSSSICLPLIWLFTSFFMERQRVPLCPQRRQGPNFGHTLGRQ